ncbi:hypothetical protein IWX90DRAFT_308988 [Phyllosticta citrichinensis]|uniref:Histone deacetylase complex subunit SAP30 Sin3 binding domain-containing protein n=1 Tax=Phyllosticta citrichinensis TaxID=1130410 RepID=A0ABR1XLQ3_9PEZI
MPPAKSRPHEHDPRPDGTAAKPDKQRGRRNGANNLTNGSHLKETMSVSTDFARHTGRGAGQQTQNASSGGMSWPSEDLSLLMNYRSSHRLDAPGAFKNPLAHAILGRGIGKYSPTMARKKNERRISKEQLATAVRKNFNALAVSESEVIVDLLYKVKMQDKAFRLRFAPPRAR